MRGLTIFSASDFRDPKLGIKSSMPQLKAGIAWLVLFHLVTRDSFSPEREVRPFEEYSDDEEKTQIRLTEDIKKKISNLYRCAGVEDPEVFETLEVAFEKCVLSSTQMEPLIVAFEIFFQLAEFEFDSTVKLSKSAERTGRERFGKTLKLTSAVRRLSYPFDLLPKPFLFLMLEWISEKKFSQEPPIRESIKVIDMQLREQILDLSARTVFRFEDDDPNKPDQFFNTLGLYVALLEGSSVKLSDREFKGPLRILKSAIQSNLLPGLVVHKHEFSLNEEVEPSYVKSLIEERKNYEYLSAIDFQGNEHPLNNGIEDDEIDSLKRNVILYGVPGSGKSFKINDEHLRDKDYVERVVFHPEYMYANFIGQILPVVSKGEVSYEFVPGPFTEILQRAISNPKQRHVLIIEEINRGNAAAIFGDIFQLLDREESGESRYGIRNHDISQIIYGNVNTEIKIPSNLFLLATMNTSDQNVFTIDTAFQRRWSMEIVPNDLTKVPWANISIAGTPVTWKDFVTEINRQITNGSDSFDSNEDKRLGAFFASEQELSTEATRSFAEKVLKYLWDDAFKFNRGRIFRDTETRTLEDVIQAFVQASPQKRWDSVFTSKLVTHLLPVEETNVLRADEELRYGRSDETE